MKVNTSTLFTFAQLEAVEFSIFFRLNVNFSLPQPAPPPLLYQWWRGCIFYMIFSLMCGPTRRRHTPLRYSLSSTISEESGQKIDSPDSEIIVGRRSHQSGAISNGIKRNHGLTFWCRRAENSIAQCFITNQTGDSSCDPAGTGHSLNTW